MILLATFLSWLTILPVDLRENVCLLGPHHHHHFHSMGGGNTVWPQKFPRIPLQSSLKQGSQGFPEVLGAADFPHTCVSCSEKHQSS